MDMFHHGFMGFGWIIWLAIIAIAVWLILRFTTKNRIKGDTSRGKSSIDILDERYAKGEIDKEEYEERKSKILNE